MPTNHGVGVEEGESLTDYIKRNNIKIKEIEMELAMKKFYVKEVDPWKKKASCKWHHTSQAITTQH